MILLTSDSVVSAGNHIRFIDILSGNLFSATMYSHTNFEVTEFYFSALVAAGRSKQIRSGAYLQPGSQSLHSMIGPISDWTNEVCESM